MESFQWLKDLFTTTDSVAHITLLYAIVIAIGVYLGKIKIFGISLGVTFVLFAGIVAGHIGFTAPTDILTFIQDFGLILFVFMIGLQVGPGFFESFGTQGIKLNGLAASAILLNILVMFACYYIFFDSSNPTNLPMMVGTLYGAVTNTPGLGAANEALNTVFPNGGPQIASAYACAYPLGVLGKSTILNSLSAALNPITGFTATANQMLGNDWYLYKGQNKDTLSIYPEIRFANGTSVVVPVDNNACFLYGFKEVSTAESGKNFPVLVKYYVNSRYQVDPSLNIVAGTKRVLCSEHLVRIVDKPVGSISKISVIPVWIESTGRYGLRMLAYNTDRIPPSDITAKIMNPATSYTTALQGVIIDGSFTPNLFNVEQNFTIKFTIPVENGHNVEYTQSFDLVLKNKNTLQEAGEGRALWNIIDPNNGECVYGVDNVTHNRPVIYWDETNQRHYISTEEFPTVEEFLEVFYRRSAPPANPDAGESVAASNGLSNA